VQRGESLIGVERADTRVRPYVFNVTSGGEIPHYVRDKRRSEAIPNIDLLLITERSILRPTMNDRAQSSSPMGWASGCVAPFCVEPGGSTPGESVHGHFARSENPPPPTGSGRSGYDDVLHWIIWMDNR